MRIRIDQSTVKYTPPTPEQKQVAQKRALRWKCGTGYIRLLIDRGILPPELGKIALLQARIKRRLRSAKCRLRQKHSN